MDPMEHGQLSHSSYQRNWGHPYQMGWGNTHQGGTGNPHQMGPGHPRQMGPGNPYQTGPGNPYQRGSKDAYQMHLEDIDQRRMMQSFNKKKRLKKHASPNEVTNIKMLDVVVKETELKKIFRCTRCQLEFKNQKMLDDHLSGSKHKKQIQANQIIEQLQKTEPCFTYDSIKRIYFCHACSLGFIKSPYELEHHFYSKDHIAKSELYRGAVKSPPLRSNNTPCQYINPYLKTDTCLSGTHSSKFWLDLIDKNQVYTKLSHSNKLLFIEDMIAQAHACLHKGYHRKIVSSIFNKSNHDEKMVIQLQKAYYKKNMMFNCTCGSELSQKELDEVRGITPEQPLEVKKPFVPIVNLYLSDTTCEGAEKSSLFWLSKIEEQIHDLNRTNQKKFVSTMITQAHACLHKDYHMAIIELLSGNIQGSEKYSGIDKLRIEYENLNNKFVCTCKTGMSQNVLQTRKAKDSCVELDTTETKEELTYEDVLDILELDD